VTVGALRAIQTGWHVNEHGGALSFPMCDEDRKVIGIRLRF